MTISQFHQSHAEAGRSNKGLSRLYRAAKHSDATTRQAAVRWDRTKRYRLADEVERSSFGPDDDWWFEQRAEIKINLRNAS